MRERVDIADVTIGMFVAELDRPWLDTPFPLQGFLVESQQEIDELRKYCKFVYIEFEQSTGSAYRQPHKEIADPQNNPPARPREPVPVREHADAGSFWATAKQILAAAFGGGASRRRASARATRLPVIESGDVPQPMPRRGGSISALELDYLVPRARPDSGERKATYVDEPAAAGAGWLTTIKSWFGSGARTAERPRDDTAAEPEALRPVYPDLSTIEEELPKAREAHEQTRRAVDQVIADVRDNKPIEVRRVQEAVLLMVESVVRNANGFIWLARLKAQDAAAYDHGLNVAVFLLAFGRHLGLPKGLLEILGTAGLMQDVGKIKLPSALLEKRTPLTAGEREVLKAHVAYSVEILESSPNASPVLIETVAQHHERLDGSGYPKGLKGDEISMLGAMAGIVDTYAAMTNIRPYREPVLPQGALQQLYGLRGTKFSPELVEKFIQCVGIFPVGSLVELNTREVAIIMAHSQIRRLKPRLMLILDPNQQPYATPIVIDLINNPSTPGGEPYRIVRGMQAGAVSPELYEKVAAGEARTQDAAA